MSDKIMIGQECAEYCENIITGMLEILNKPNEENRSIGDRPEIREEAKMLAQFKRELSGCSQSSE